MKFEKYTSLEAAFKAAKDTGSLNVINSSDKKGVQTLGRLVLEITTEDDRKISVTLPPTWIPFNLIDWATLEAIMRSTDIRSYFRMGLISFVPDAVAVELRKQPSYLAEADKWKKYGLGIQEPEAETEELAINIGSTRKVTPDTVITPNIPTSVSTNPIASEMIRMHYEFSSNNLDFPTYHDYVKSNLVNLSKKEWEYITSEINDRQSFLFQVAVNCIGSIDVGDPLILENFEFYAAYVENMV